MRAPPPVFVGRVDELRRVADALHQAPGGMSGMVVVVGDAGVGKTRLVTEATALRPPGMALLSGGCQSLGDAALPYGPFVEALRVVGPAAVDGLCGAALLGRLLPGLLTNAQPGPVEGFTRTQLFEVLLTLLHRIAEPGGLLLVVEDLHWADAASLALLGFLARNLDGAGVLLVCTARRDALHREHPLRALLSELERRESVQRLDLGPLTPAEIAAVLGADREYDLPASTLAAVTELAEGNPFFAQQLLAARARGDRLPALLSDSLLARTWDLSDDARLVLRTAAVIGRRVGHALLAQASGLGRQELVQSLRETVEQQLIDAVPGSEDYEFRHALLREAVLDELLPGERTGLHEAVAQALSAAPAAPAAVFDIAHHWRAAHRIPESLAASVRAGLAAAAVFAYSEAKRHLELALELWPQVPGAAELAGLPHTRLLAHAAEAARWHGDPARAAALVRTALAQGGSGPEAAELLERLGRYLWETGDSAAASEAYDEARRRLEAGPATALLARVLAAQGAALMLAGSYHASQELCLQAIEVARSIDARAELAHALNTYGVDCAMLGDGERGIDALQESKQLVEELQDLEGISRADNNLSFVLANLGRVRDALAVELDGLATCRRYGLERTMGAVLVCNAGASLHLLGQWDDAERVIREALDAELPEGFAAFAHQTLANLAIARGQPGAQELLNTVWRLAERLREPQLAGPLKASAAEAALWAGNVDAAARHVEQGLAAVADTEHAVPTARLCAIGLRVAADRAEELASLPAQGDLAAVRATAERLLALAGRLAARPRPLPEVTLSLLLCEAEAARLDDRCEPVRWERVRDCCAELEWPYPRAYAEFRLAETLLAAGRRPAAAGALSSAVRTARKLGAAPLLAGAEGLARRARLDLDPDEPPTPDEPSAAAGVGLTRREVEVLGHLVAGATNRQIARALFISEKTASVHVSNIISKLQVGNRGQAAAAAHRLRLLPAQ